MIGDPGVGKTTIVEIKVSAEVGLIPEVMVLSNYDETTLVGFPIPDGKGSIKRTPFPVLQRAMDNPRLLILDEFVGIPRSMEPVCLRLALERRLEEQRMHKHTPIVLLSNDPEQVGAGSPLSAAMVGRLGIYRYSPVIQTELSGYFNGLCETVVPDAGAIDAQRKERFETFAAIRDLGNACPYRQAAFKLFAKLVAKTPTLVTLSPPTDTVNGSMVPWASPRQWEMACRVYARCMAAGMVDANGKPSRLVRIMVEAHVGSAATSAFFALRELQGVFPEPEEIANNPKTAKIPDDEGLQLAGMGIVEKVAQLDAWAAWIYVARFDGEIRLLMARALGNRRGKPGTKHMTEGMKVYATLLPAINKALARGQ